MMNEQNDTSKNDLAPFISKFESAEGFDMDAFKELLQETDADTVLRILARFRDTLRQTIEAIDAALTKNDTETLWRSFHKLAGSAELLGFAKLGHLSRELNEQLRAHSEIEGLRPEINEVLTRGRQLSNDLETVCPNLQHYL